MLEVLRQAGAKRFYADGGRTYLDAGGAFRPVP
jgi:hypothetical protein